MANPMDRLAFLMDQSDLRSSPSKSGSTINQLKTSDTSMKIHLNDPVDFFTGALSVYEDPSDEEAAAEFAKAINTNQLLTSMLLPDNAGEISAPDMQFTPIAAVKSMLYKFKSTTPEKKVTEIKYRFFEGKKFWKRTWSL
jgi:hypothetical protein